MFAISTGDAIDECNAPFEEVPVGGCAAPLGVALCPLDVLLDG